MNPKIHVCKIRNNFQKAGVMLWQSTVLRRLWHRITDATHTARCKLLTSTKNRKARLEFAKKHKVCKRWARRVLELCLWTDETKMKLYLSDGKAKVWRKKENCKWSQAYSLICKAWWRWFHGMGMHGCLWNRPAQLYWWLNVWWPVAEWIWKGTKPSCLPIFKKMPPDSLGSASYCIRTMIQNTLPVQ